MLITINTEPNKTGAGKIGNTFGDFIMTIFKIFAKFLGIILIIAVSHLNDIIYRHVYLGSSSFTFLGKVL
jgi:hypothetical protein